MTVRQQTGRTDMDEFSTLTIPEFLRVEKLSNGTYYNLPPELRPRVMKIGRATRISPEAHREWRALMERLTAAALAEHPDPEPAAALRDRMARLAREWAAKAA